MCKLSVTPDLIHYSRIVLGCGLIVVALIVSISAWSAYYG